MSIWADIHKRSNGIAVKKEDENVKIADALAKIDNEYDVGKYSTYPLKVFSRDKSGNIFIDSVACNVFMFFNIKNPYSFRKSLNAEVNINRIKSVIGDRTFVSLEKL